jgi:hypothetical protein
LTQIKARVPHREKNRPNPTGGMGPCFRCGFTGEADKGL